MCIRDRKQTYCSKDNRAITIPYIWFLTDDIKTESPLDICNNLPTSSGILIRSYKIKNKVNFIKGITNLKNVNYTLFWFQENKEAVMLTELICPHGLILHFF